MFFVKIHYGLGNQLFQYALARRISVERQMPFKMDVSFFTKNISENETKRFYELNKFKIEENIATEQELKPFVKHGLVYRLTSYFERTFLPYYKRSEVCEKHPAYDQNVLRIGNGSYLNGYWQNEAYFKPVENIIRQDLQFRSQPDAVNAVVLDKISSTPSSIAIHIRRGDYLTDKTIASVLYPCSMTYYQNAIDFFARKVENPVFFIFSDDPEWAEINFKIQFPHFIVSGYNADRPVEELRLMSACRHFVIANSSFSWWAAWLGRFSDKIVLAPKYWFKSGLNISAKDWHQLG